MRKDKKLTYEDGLKVIQIAMGIKIQKVRLTKEYL